MTGRKRDGDTSQRLRLRSSNHMVELRRGVLHCKIGDAKHLTLAQGARDAALFSENLQGVLYRRDAAPIAAVIDVRSAPTIVGPKSRKSIGVAIAAWERAERPIVFVVGDDPIKNMQFGQLVREHGPVCGKVVRDDISARSFYLEFTRNRRAKTE